MFKQTVQRTDEDETVKEEEEEIGEDDDFEEREVDGDISFQCYCKHLSCFVHTLQSVIQTFSRDATFKLLPKKGLYTL